MLFCNFLFCCCLPSVFISKYTRINATPKTATTNDNTEQATTTIVVKNFKLDPVNSRVVVIHCRVCIESNNHTNTPKWWRFTPKSIVCKKHFVIFCILSLTLCFHRLHAFCMCAKVLCSLFSTKSRKSSHFLHGGRRVKSPFVYASLWTHTLVAFPSSHVILRTIIHFHTDVWYFTRLVVSLLTKVLTTLMKQILVK